MRSPASARADGPVSPRRTARTRCGWMRVHPVRGLSLVEILVALALGALILGGLINVLGGTLAAREHARSHSEALEEARHAMERMVRALQATQRLMIPKADNPGTAWDESVREPGVLAMTLDLLLDRNADGIIDADNDGDGRVDEDPDTDSTNDGAPGIVGIDDDGDGAVDDEGDSTVDEGASSDDDDEDGASNEDWFDPVVFRIVAGALVERVPVPWDEDASGSVTGTDFIERTLAAGVSRFRVVRLPGAGTRPPLVQITLDLTAASGDLVTLTRAVRVGGGQ